MNHKDDSVYIEHMLECIERIQSYIGGGEEEFRHSTLIQDAVIRNLQIMAESSQRISDKIKGKHPQIPWREISGFRNILVHDYLGIDLDAVWSVIEHDLPVLEQALAGM